MALGLVSKGVPFDVAFEISDEDRVTWTIIFGQLDGGEFDWTKWEWRKRTP